MWLDEIEEFVPKYKLGFYTKNSMNRMARVLRELVEVADKAKTVLAYTCVEDPTDLTNLRNEIDNLSADTKELLK